MNKDWKEELRGYFFSHKYLDIDAAIEVKKANIPKRLFKYREVNDDALDNLLNDTVWCSNSEDFNDPYDSSLCFDFSESFLDGKFFEHFNRHQEDNDKNIITNQEIQKIFSSKDPLKTIIDIACFESGEEISSDMEDKLHSVLTDFTKKQMVDMNEKFNGAMKKGYKICSFSERDDSMLMWSHYSKRHTGFIMEYDFKSLPISDVTSRSLWPVIYDDTLFDASAFMAENKESDVINHFFGIIASIHKANDWKYEREWRLIIPLGPNDPPFNYAVPTPVAVYLGSKAKDNEKTEDVVRIASKKKIPIYRMALVHNQFKMVPEKLENYE